MSRPFWLVLFVMLGFASTLWGEETGWISEVDRLYLERDQRINAESALSILRKELADHPKNDEALWRMSRALKWEGDQKKESSEKIAMYEQAVEMARRGVEANPKSVGGHFWLGVGLGKIGETRGVLRSLFLVDPIKKEMMTVLFLDPTNDGAHLVLGVMYRKLPGFIGGSNKRSVEELKKAITFNPRSTLHHLELAKTYIEESQTDRAEGELRTLLTIMDPSDPVEGRKDKREAEKMLSELKPN
jgi:tetratricopeptide (TPR) repeat protein